MSRYTFVADLPDLIDADEYSDHPEGNLVRLVLRSGPDGVEIDADAMRPAALERLLRHLSDAPIQQMLCG